MDGTTSDTDELLDRASRGDTESRRQLFEFHRKRLLCVVARQIDRRLSARLDPSDVVQEALAIADRRLDDYLRRRPVPFFPWLRQLADERLAGLYRRHVQAQRRSVCREEALSAPQYLESVEKLAERMMRSGSRPGSRVMRDELCGRVHAAIQQLSENDRAVLILRHLEQRPTAEVAKRLGITVGAVRVRSMRAIARLRDLLDDLFEESEA